MPLIGFSTGALFRDALADGVRAARQMHLPVIELSALRLRELKPLAEFVRTADLGEFDHVSVHAPTDYTAHEERAVAAMLRELALQRAWRIVIHPDCIWNVELWKPLGERLCIENMDKRKSIGRTVEELIPLFETFPQARLCFDIAHAYQVDTSMTEAYRILRDFKGKICQLHVSEVTSSSRHDRISETALSAFREVVEFLPQDVPVILETPVKVMEAQRELQMAARIFEPATVAAQA